MTTYRGAGVDLDAADDLVARIAPAVMATWPRATPGGFGGFAAGVAIPSGYERPLVVLSTDGVGTKAELARRAGRLDGLGADLVAMCVDDVVAVGARPLAMTDYLAVGRLDVDRYAPLVASIAAACAHAGVALVGGETAEHPGVLAEDAFDLAGTAMGVVEDGHQIDGATIGPGDVVLGIASPNLRCNGFSLVRAAIDGLALDAELPGTGRAVAEVLLEPSVIYAPAIVALGETMPLHGLAHVTGGGISTNLARVLPREVTARIDPSSWPVPAVFSAIARIGDVADAEMLRTFNMGIGFVVVLAPALVDEARAALDAHGHVSHLIGEIVRGDGTVTIG